MVIAILVLVTVVSIVACHMIAASRGGNGVFWGTMGLVFGPLAIPFAFRARPRRHPTRNAGESPSP